MKNGFTGGGVGTGGSPPGDGSSLIDLLRARAAEARPGADYVFLTDGEREDRRVTYAALDLRAREIAASLQGLARPGDRALLLYPPGLEFMESFFGCLYAGIVAVPAYPPRPNRSLERIASIVASASPTLILTTASLAAKAGAWADRVPGFAAARWLATDEPSPGTADLWCPLEAAPRSLAFLQYTSGSTATPKGVMVSHANLLDNQRQIRRAFRQTADSVVVSWLPPYHDMGLIGALLQPLFVGGSCVLMPPAAFLQKPLRWLQAISRYRATTSGGPDFAYALCVARTTPEQRRELDLSSWQVAFNGAEPVRAATLARFAETFGPCGFRPEAFFPCYGLAEATLMVTAAAGARTVSLAGAELQRHRVVPEEGGEGALHLVGCGRTGETARIAIADPETRAPVSPGGVGEIWLQSPSVAGGYWGQPEASRETFAARLAGEDGPFLRTGDLGFLLDGELFVTGRLKDLVIIRGRNHYPQDLERTAERSHPALRPNCGAAFSVTVDGEERLVIVQEIDRRREAEAAEAAEGIRAGILGEHDLNPFEVVVIRAGNIPKTSSGKIQRGACRDRYLQDGMETLARRRAGEFETARLVDEEDEDFASGEEPPTALMEALRGAVAGVLRRRPEEIPVHVPLARLGLDSLAASELAGRIEEELGRQVPLPDLLDGQSLRGLALELASGGELPARAASEHKIEDETEDKAAAGPLSYGQRALWYLAQLAPASAAYHLVAAATLRGGLDRDALRRAFQTLVDRHAALRTTLATGADGEPAQQVRDAMPDGFAILETAPADLDGLLEWEAARRFDLERGPLLRVLLVRRSEWEHTLLVVLHHIAADFWSLTVLADELGRLYTCFRAGLDADRAGLAPPSTSPTAHARLERELLAGPEGERLGDYWRQQLAGSPQQLELPTDRRRPQTQGFRGGKVRLTLDADLSSRIAAHGRGAGATPFTTLLAAFALLLHRLSRQEDLLIGVPTAGRETAGLARAVGYYVNPVVVRSQAAAGAPFAAGLAALRRDLLAAFAHRAVPFPWLAERLQPVRDPGRSPLFQVMLVQQQAPGFAPAGLPGFALGLPGARLALGELVLEVAPLAERSSQMDLALFVAPVEDGLALGLQYDSDLFDAATARRLLSQLATLLDRAIADSEAPADALPLLAEAELHQVSREWNDTGIQLPDATLPDLLAAQTARTPGAVAIVHGGERLTYRELDASAERLARVLAGLGVGPEERVGIFAARSLDLVVALLAVLKAGGAYVPLDPAYPAARLAFMVEDARPRVVLTHSRLRDRLPACEGSQVVDLDGRWWEAGPPPPADPQARAGAGNLAYLIYTSGSTGRPKAVALEHRSAVALCAWGRETFSPEELAGVLAATSISFDLSVFELFVPLAWGGTVLLVEDALALTAGPPETPVRLINTVPAVMAEVVRAGAIPASTITVALAGEVLNGSLVREIHRHPGVRRVLNLYGPSESTTYATGAEPGRDEERPAIGRPIPGTVAFVLDPGLRPLPVGVPGELYLGGHGLARGYFGRPDVTAERFVPDPVTGLAGRRLYRCGDLARYRPDGQLDFLGRVDTQVKVRGFRIELGEIEAALAEHPGVLEAVAVLADVAGEQRLVAYAATSSSAAPALAELEAHLRSRLPAHAVPAALMVLEALPRSPGGKVDRRRLPAPGKAAEPVESAFRTPLEEVLAALWCEVLGLESVGVHDDFFALGGHSLLAARLSSRVRQSLDRELPLAAVLEHPTVARLARRLTGAAEAPPVPIPRGGPLPVSPAQRRLWFLDRFQPGRATYNLPMAVHLQGALDIAALRQALAEVSRRHESLRTTFGEVEGLPRQLVAPPGPVSLPSVDLSGLPEPGAESPRLARAEAARPFDLAAGPLLRCLMLRLAADRHVLVLTLHHAVADGWSLDILLDELATLYGAFAAGAASPLGESPVQPADCAAWEIERLEAGALEDQAAAWVRRLAGAPAAVDLPLDRPRPAIPSGRGGMCGDALEAAAWADLLRLARRHGATPFMVLLAGWAALLHRLTGQEDLVVGTPVARRGRVELEGLVGLFLNTLPLRLACAGGETADDLVARSRQVCLDAYSRQELPFDLLVEALRPGRTPSQNPLFNVLLVQEPAPRRRAVAGLELWPEALPTGTAKLDLTLFVAERDGAAGLSLEFDHDLFDLPTAARHMRQLGELLPAMARDATVLMSELPLLSAAERHQLVVEANEWAAVPEPPGCLHQLVEAQARCSPDRVAVAAASGDLTYRDLDRRASGVALHLRALGVGPETPVGVFLERTPDLVVAILGVLKAGGAYLPLDPGYPEARLRFMLEDAGAAMVLTSDTLAPRLPAGTRCIPLDPVPELDRPGLDRAGTAAPEAVDADNLAYLIYTSGSTGRPKGVAIRHGGAVAMVEWAREAFTDEECEAVVGSTSVCFDLSVFELFVPLSRGGRVVLMRDALELLARDESITLVNTVPSVLVALLEQGPLPRSVRSVNLAGEALSAALVARLAEEPRVNRIRNLYGPSEDTTYSTWAEIPIGAGGPPSIGRPLPGTAAHVLDRGMRPAPLGVPGELFLGGTGLARGYHGRPDLTAERFVPDPFGAPGTRLYRTGDLVRRRTDGGLDFLGRTDQQVKVRGFRVEPGEIEAALLAHGGVRQAAVVARRDGADGEVRLTAFFVPATEAPPSAAELRVFLRGRLPDSFLPASFVPLAALPLTPSGKLDRRALPEPPGRETTGEGAGARGPVEEVLAAVWAEMLGREPGASDDFFSLGGHSLLAVRVVSRLRDAFKVELPVRALFEAPSLSALARRVEELRRGGRPEDLPLARSGETGPAPLSSAQQRLWLLHRFEPASPAYHIAGAIRLNGALRPGALAAAVASLVERQAALRTVFRLAGAGLLQVEVEGMTLPLPRIDLRQLPPSHREEEARRIAREEARRPFDLTAGPPGRMALLPLDDGEHLLLATFHHIVSDGWSFSILLRELAALYSAHAEGSPAALARLPVAYTDYARWQRRQLETEAMGFHLAYWRDRLAGSLPVLELPADRPRPKERGEHGRRQPFPLAAGLSERLAATGRRHGVSPFMILLAAFQCLLRRYTGEEDLLVGTPVANRERAEVEGLVGCFVNTLVLRTWLDANLRFADLLARVRETTLEAFDHQALPFERLVEELRPGRDLAHTPLFQVLFVMQNTPHRIASLPGLTLTEESVDTDTAKFDLTLAVEETAGGPVATIEYATDLFDAASIARLAGHFARLLEDALAAPGRRCDDLPLLGESERHQVVVEWNDTRAERPPELLHAFLSRQAERTPEAMAAVCGAEGVTYRELDRWANQVARHLRESGVLPGAVVGLCAERSLELMAGLFGILKTGAAYLPLDADAPVQRLALIAAEAGISVLLAQERLIPNPPAGHRVVYLDRHRDEIARQSPTDPGAAVEPDDLAYVLYSSGSTGRPKGIMSSHRAIGNRLLWMQSAYGLTPEDRVLQKTPYGFDVSVWELFWPSLVGARLTLAAPGGHRDPAYLSDLIRREGITVLHFVPSLLQLFLDQPDLSGCASLRLVVCSGEALPVALARRCRERLPAARLENLYGPTEAAVDVTAWRCAPREDERSIPIGRPIDNVHIALLDEGGQPTPVGIPGELCIGGVAPARGYLARPDLTAASFVPDPLAAEPGARRYRTGDLARRLPGGEIEFLGRLDFQVKIRGVRIEPGEVEAALLARPDVREAVVIARDGTRGGLQLIAYLVPAAATGPEAGELRSFLRERLPEAMIPAAFVILPELPLGRSGKVDRRALPSPEPVAATAEYVAPRTAIEEQLATLWVEVLGVARAGIGDNFFDLGGHSLLATQLLSRIKDTYYVDLPLRDLFAAPTVEGLAGIVTRRIVELAGSDLVAQMLADVETEAMMESAPEGYAG